jgi:hypothetical protein
VVPYYHHRGDERIREQKFKGYTRTFIPIQKISKKKFDIYPAKMTCEENIQENVVIEFITGHTQVS